MMILRGLRRLLNVSEEIRFDSRGFGTSRTKCSSLLTPLWKQKVLNSNVLTSPFIVNHVPETSFPEFVFLQMEKWRNNKMIINGLTGEIFTYHDSLRLCTKITSALLRLGLTPGQKVAFCSFTLPEYFISWLAVLAAGGVCTDINPNSTSKEIKDQLDRTETTILFVHPSCAVAALGAASNSPSVRKTVVFGNAMGCVPFSQLAQDDGSLFKGPHPVENPRTAIAQLPCSSGTTGIPKLVQKSHYSFTAMAMSCIYPEISQSVEQDVSLLVLPLYHTMAHFMLGGDLIVGCCNVFLPKFSPETYLEAIQKYKVTTKPVVPPLVLFLLQHPLVKNYDLSSLRGLLCGAAPVAEDLLDQIQATFKLDYIRQGYGMTELCPISVGLNDGKFQKGSAGVPVNQTEVKIIDVETGKPLGPNQPGEIWARGPPAMSGYFNNEDATAATLDRQGWVHSGDIGMFNEECQLFVVDRIKDLIKYKGHQVAPAELESMLLNHPAVKDAAVIGIPDQRAGELTRAYVVVEDSAAGKIKEDALIRFVAEQMAPEKHLHGGVVFLKEIPKSPTGKVLKKILRANL